jgi:2',3'-cyclic-nucleotide 2'-phosphodiesterase (5'-nucleotidase family)
VTHYSMRYLYLPLLVISVLFYSCKSTRKLAARPTDDRIEFVLVQVNDVYEIAPLTGGLHGGMARVATVKKEQLRSNPNTFLVMGGDFLSPSVYNSLKYEGKRIRGAQMVDAMNAAGFDIAVFGNHEFDISDTDLQERLDESAFQWVSSNCYYKTGDSLRPFSKKGQPLPKTYTINIKDNDGTTAKIGFVGITLPTTTSPYVHYEDPKATAKKYFDELKDSCDAVIAITHQAVKDDIGLAQMIPQLPVIVGGHEHDMRFEKIGNVFITKAHANAKSAYILKLSIDKKTKTVKVIPELKELDSTVAFDSTTNAVVQKWNNRANENYASLGFDPSTIVIQSGDSLEGREIYTRDTSTNLTELIVKSMQYACPEADMVIMNSGSIRVDDILYPPVSQYDFLRTLPFGGSIREVEMKGSLLTQVLEAGKKNRGAGGFLQYGPVINIDAEKTYRVALTDFLLTGGETNLGFLTEDNPLITKVFPDILPNYDPRVDIRLAIVRYLTK